MALQDPQAEPSMEEILASIRRIISEEEQAPAQEEVLDLTQAEPEPAAPAPVEDERERGVVDHVAGAARLGHAPVEDLEGARQALGIDRKPGCMWAIVCEHCQNFHWNIPAPTEPKDYNRHNSAGFGRLGSA